MRYYEKDHLDNAAVTVVAVDVAEVGHTDEQGEDSLCWRNNLNNRTTKKNVLIWDRSVFRSVKGSHLMNRTKVCKHKVKAYTCAAGLVGDRRGAIQTGLRQRIRDGTACCQDRILESVDG